MSPQEWMNETERRIEISEGRRAAMYHDSLGIPTIGVGFNLQRGDARECLLKAGVPPNQVDAVLDGTGLLTNAEIDALFAISFDPIVSEARASLAPGVFDSMSDARRFVICDLVFNMGNDGWLGFPNTRALINQAQIAKNEGRQSAHELFVIASEHLEESDWYHQVGERAQRNVAMLRSGIWCKPDGDGSDI